ncbi:hypothetical protein [Streptomyces sp. NPDC000618]|uniref:hypothetical protein n=1 Tax=Streptomyces sp. NPDC000618 TaxID=3154265 RepID=UPI00331BF7FE
MPNLKGWLAGSKLVQSWLGWPVPAAVRLASPPQLRDLIAAADARGYSRKGRGLDLEAGKTFAIVPYLQESSPEDSWMCLVVSFTHSMVLEPGVRPECDFGRLDIAMADLEKLPPAAPGERDQLLHWMAWEAYRGRDRP